MIQHTIMKTYHPQKMRRRRNHPHWQSLDGVYFITFRLSGSLPKEVIEELRLERLITEKNLLEKGLSKEETQLELKELRHLYYGKFDELLDNSTTGPHFLEEPEAAQIVINAIMHFDNERYKIICYTIMSNHVHFVFYKLQMEIQDILGSLK